MPLGGTLFPETVLRDLQCSVEGWTCASLRASAGTGCEKGEGLGKIGLQSCPRVCWDPMELVSQHGGHGELQPLAETMSPEGQHREDDLKDLQTAQPVSWWPSDCLVPGRGYEPSSEPG